MVVQIVVDVCKIIGDVLPLGLVDVGLVFHAADCVALLAVRLSHQSPETAAFLKKTLNFIFPPQTLKK